VGTYAVQLQVRTAWPLTSAQLELLDGGWHAIAAAGRPHGLTLEVHLTIVGGDVVGAPARSLNTMLDVVPDLVRRAEVVETEARPGNRQGRRQGGSGPSV
jgi:hypothetical protein